MKINLVSNVTYQPVRTGANKTVSGANNAASAKKADSISQFNKVLMEKLSPSETNEIRKLFGDFNPASTNEIRPQSQTESQSGIIPPGQFVDIFA